MRESAESLDTWADRIVALLFGLLLWMCTGALTALVLAPRAGWLPAAVVAVAFVPAVAILVITALSAGSIGRRA